MTLVEVIANLENTIAGKQILLDQWNQDLKWASMGESMALIASIELLRINISELDRILSDLKEIK